MSTRAVRRIRADFPAVGGQVEPLSITNTLATQCRPERAECDTKVQIGNILDMEGGQRQSASGAELLDKGEAALARGDSRQAFDLLARACQVGVEVEQLGRLARAFATAGHYQGRHADVRQWIETALLGDLDPFRRLAFLRARIVIWRHLDLARVQQLIEEALAAAEEVGNDEAYGDILAHGAFAAYRRSDQRAANEYAARAGAHEFSSASGRYAAFRARMFAAVVAGDLEKSIRLSTQARACAREINNPAGMANESNNLAEFHLDLGYPFDGQKHAHEAVQLARKCGHRSLELLGEALSASTAGQVGSLDEALNRFDKLRANDLVFAVDIATAHTFWLLERRAAGDAIKARNVAIAAIARADRAGILNRLSPLYANLARCNIHSGDRERAHEVLEKARKAAERAEVPSRLLLALAVAEVFPSDESIRKVVLNQARVSILRTAERRDDPWAYCVNVRLNRRLLELSGGVPTDLPRRD